MSLRRDPDKTREWRERGARKYRDKVRDEVLSGERESSLKPSRIKPPTKAKREKRFARNYGSKEYLKHLHALPCAICEATGWTEAAHTEGGGMGMKAGPHTMVPLCGTRHLGTAFAVEGCHQVFDRHPWDLPDGTDARLKRQAKSLWQRWEAREE